VNGERLEIVVVYRSPSDYPGEFVARCQYACGEGGEPRIERDPELLARGRTLEEVRKVIQAKRPGKALLERHPLDDPVIVETWI